MPVQKSPRPRAWPVGARLRVKPDADIQAKHLYVRGTPVLVVGPLKWSKPGDGLKDWSWRQRVLVFGLRRHSVFALARPDHLEQIPDDPLHQQESFGRRRRELPKFLVVIEPRDESTTIH